MDLDILPLRLKILRSRLENLRKKGIEVEKIRIDEFTGRKFTFFSDPDDLPIELYEITCN